MKALPTYVFVQEVKRDETIYGRIGDICLFLGNIGRGSRVILSTPGNPEVTVPLGAVKPQTTEAVAA